MSGTLTFPINDTLKSIVAHAAAATSRRPTYEQLFDDANLKPESRGKDAFKRTEDDIDQSKLKPALLLVKDRGAYLMSNGRPNQMSPDGIGCVVAYAKGHNPDTRAYDYDKTRRVCGGDDFVQDLDLEFFQKAIARGAANIRIKLTDTSIRMEA